MAIILKHMDIPTGSWYSRVHFWEYCICQIRHTILQTIKIRRLLLRSTTNNGIVIADTTKLRFCQTRASSKTAVKGITTSLHLFDLEWVWSVTSRVFCKKERIFGTFYIKIVFGPIIIDTHNKNVDICSCIKLRYLFLFRCSSLLRVIL